MKGSTTSLTPGNYSVDGRILLFGPIIDAFGRRPVLIILALVLSVLPALHITIPTDATQLRGGISSFLLLLGLRFCLGFFFSPGMLRPGQSGVQALPLERSPEAGSAQ